MEQVRAKDDVAGTTIMQDPSQDTTLALHNSFTLLTKEIDIPTREASVVVKEHPIHTIDTPQIVNEIDVLNVESELLEQVQGEKSTPRPSSLVQWSDRDKLPPFTFPVPITARDEELGPDKRKIQAAESSKQYTAASLKSAKIFSKFWGDVVDSETDGTMDLDTDSEMNMHPVALKYLEAQPDANHQPMSYRKTKKNSSNQICTKNLAGSSSARGQGSDGITSSESIQTRSKKGVIKTNPKYVGLS